MPTLIELKDYERLLATPILMEQLEQAKETLASAETTYSKAKLSYNTSLQALKVSKQRLEAAKETYRDQEAKLKANFPNLNDDQHYEREYEQAIQQECRMFINLYNEDQIEKNQSRIFKTTKQVTVDQLKNFLDRTLPERKLKDSLQKFADRHTQLLRSIKEETKYTPEERKQNAIERYKNKHLANQENLNHAEEAVAIHSKDVELVEAIFQSALDKVTNAKAMVKQAEKEHQQLMTDGKVSKEVGKRVTDQVQEHERHYAGLRAPSASAAHQHTTNQLKGLSEKVSNESQKRALKSLQVQKVTEGIKTTPELGRRQEG